MTAMEHGTVTPRVLWERAYILVARNRANEVGPLLVALPAGARPAGDVAERVRGGVGRQHRGRRRGGRRRSSAAGRRARSRRGWSRPAALGAMKDKRRGSRLRERRCCRREPHRTSVAAALGASDFDRVDYFRRKPTYE